MLINQSLSWLSCLHQAQSLTVQDPIRAMELLQQIRTEMLEHENAEDLAADCRDLLRIHNLLASGAVRDITGLLVACIDRQQRRSTTYYKRVPTPDSV